MEDFKEDIDSNTIILGDYNTPLSQMDRSSQQNISKDIVSLNNTLDEMDWTDIYTAFHPKEAKYTFFSTWNIFTDRPHDRTQNKLQQIQENWNHIKHFLWPQGTETGNQPQGKSSKTLKLMEIEQNAIKQWMGLEWGQGSNQKVSGNKWKWTHNNQKLMEHSKGSPEREVHSHTHLPKKDRNISNKQPNPTSTSIERKTTNKAQSE